MQLRALGPGMMQQIQQPCSACSQTGYSVPASDKCGSCAGKGLLPEKKVFDVHIAKVGRPVASLVCCRGFSLTSASDRRGHGVASGAGMEG